MLSITPPFSRDNTVCPSRYVTCKSCCETFKSRYLDTHTEAFHKETIQQLHKSNLDRYVAKKKIDQPHNNRICVLFASIFGIGRVFFLQYVQKLCLHSWTEN